MFKSSYEIKGILIFTGGSSFTYPHTKTTATQIIIPIVDTLITFLYIWRKKKQFNHININSYYFILHFPYIAITMFCLQIMLKSWRSIFDANFSTVFIKDFKCFRCISKNMYLLKYCSAKTNFISFLK